VNERPHPHTVLGESIRSFAAVIDEVTRRVATLDVPHDSRDEQTLRDGAREVEEAWSRLAGAQEVLEAEMHQLRDLLEAERIRYRDLFEWAPDAYVVTDADGKILETNRAAEHLLGMSRDILVRKRFETLLERHGQRSFRTILTRLPGLERLGDWELTICRGDGTVFPAAVTVSSVRDRNGLVTGLRWLLRDATERKEAEERAAAAQVDLKRRVRERTDTLVAVDRERAETMARLEAVLDQIPAAIVIAHATTGTIVTANDYAEQLLEQVAGADAGLETWLTIGRKAGGAPYARDDRPIVRALRTGEASAGDQIVFQRLDGTFGVFETSAAPVRNPEGEVVAAVAAYWDVTERERRARAEREFVTNAAHELRTPLAAIGSAVEVLQSGAKETRADRDRFLNHVEQQTKRLQRLVRSLLVLARAQTGQEAAETEVINVESLLDEIQRQSPDRLRVDVRLREGTGVVAHRDLAEQALLNLVLNAAKYAPDGEIVLSGSEENGFVALEVVDSGPGIPPDEQERVLERFYRGEDGSGVEGFGLGLAIAAQVAESLHGQLELSPSEAGGTRARLLLPAAHA